MTPVNDGVNRTVFIVDDEPDVREVMEDFLTEHGYHVEQAAYGMEALEKIALMNPKPKLILLDVMMPYMDGFEVLYRIRQNPKTALIPVVMLTAKGETTTIMRAQELRADDFISKPFDIPEFLRMVAKYVS